MLKYNLCIFFSQVFHSYILFLLLGVFLSPVIFESNFVLKSNKPLSVCFLIAIFPVSRIFPCLISKFSVLIMTCLKTGKQIFELHGCLFYFCFFSLSFKKPVWVVLTFIECCWLLNTLHYFTQIKEKLFFLKDNLSKNDRQVLVSIVFSSTNLLIPFVFFFFQSSSVH